LNSQDAHGVRCTALCGLLREPVERVEIFGAGLLHDFLRQFRAGRGLVPGGEGLEIVAQVLLVEAGLGSAGLVGVGGPEAGAVGGEDFIGEQEAAGPGFAAKFEFGVGDKDAALGGVGGGPGLEVEGQFA